MSLYIKYITGIIIMALFISCTEDDDSYHSDGFKLFVTLQDSDGVAIIDSQNLDILETINIDLKETEISTKGRHDPCIGIRAVPVGEAMMATTLADHCLRFL